MLHQIMKLVNQHLDEVAAMALFGIGFTVLLLDKNLIKKIIGFSMMDSGIYLFLASYGYIGLRRAPVYTNGVTDSVTAVMLGLTVRLYQQYHTLDIDEIAEQIRKEGK